CRMDQYRAANRAKWDELVQPHLTSGFYSVDALRDGTRRLDPIVERELGDVSGLSILHLQCHFGLDTLTLARRGARVTGLDFSPEAITVARGLAAETGLDATFVEGDLYAAPELIEGAFDLVFTTWGTICWLPDLAGWARIASGFLKPGGALYYADCHPMAYVWDEGEGACTPATGHLKAKYPYFHDTAPTVLDDPDDYGSDHKTENTLTYEWAHPVGEIVTTVARAGLVFEFLHEHTEIAWALLPSLVQQESGLHSWPAGTDPVLPLSLSFKAVKPT
ncbi:MAG: class I SAM-dependent methyltransferase, partial [Thalassobaculaceae bacterium]|nr:class I SAM-dependent methyltransferase [Thalassobaculaceae bacterium]